MGDSVILRLTEWTEGLYRAVKFAKMIIETSMSSQNLSGRSKVSLIHPDQILGELVPPENVKARGGGKSFKKPKKLLFPKSIHFLTTEILLPLIYL